jgi:hypothetical protein
MNHKITDMFRFECGSSLREVAIRMRNVFLSFHIKL